MYKTSQAGERERHINDYGKKWCEQREQVMNSWRVTENFTEWKKITGMKRDGGRGSDGMQEERGNERGPLMERESVCSEKERERWLWEGVREHHVQKEGGQSKWPTDWGGNLGTCWWVKRERTVMERQRVHVMRMTWCVAEHCQIQLNMRLRSRKIHLHLFVKKHKQNLTVFYFIKNKYIHNCAKFLKM